MSAATPAIRSRLGIILVTLFAFIASSSAQSLEENKSPLAVVKDLYSAFERGDLDSIERLLSSDTVWTFHGPEHLIPYAGVYKGPEGVRQFFAEVNATVDVRAIGQREFVQQANTIAVVGWERSVARETGGEFLANWLHLWEVRNGVIVRFEEFTDSAAIVAALEPADPARGKAYFTTCAGCHGTAAQGNAGMHAPNLTIQGKQYLLGQLRHFARDIRGGPQDFYGWQMNGRAKALPDDRALRDVVAYVESLPKHRADATVRGNVAAGKLRYEACASCHGTRAEGSAAMGSPALAGVDDWYLLAQLQAYRKGQRGTHKDDPLGSQMRAAALALPAEDTLRDVVAYIASLP
jgi:hypothetical protein